MSTYDSRYIKRIGIAVEMADGELIKGWWIGHQAKLYGIEEALRLNPYDLKSSIENSETKENNV